MTIETVSVRTHMPGVTGHATFCWEDGHKVEVPVMHKICGLHHNNHRPKSVTFQLQIDERPGPVDRKWLNYWTDKCLTALAYPPENTPLQGTAKAESEC